MTTVLSSRSHRQTLGPGRLMRPIIIPDKLNTRRVLALEATATHVEPATRPASSVGRGKVKSH